MEIGYPLRDREPQARTLGVAAGALSTVETLEDARQLVAGNSDPGVGHDHRTLTVPRHYVEPDVALRRRVLDSVVEHDQHEAARQIWIAKDLGLFERTDLQYDTLLLRERPRRFYGLRSDVV